MKPEKYAAFICLCAVEKTPEKVYNREVKDLAEDVDYGIEYTEKDFEYWVKTKHGHHFASKKDVEGWLRIYGSNPIGFWGEEKAKELGF